VVRHRRSRAWDGPRRFHAGEGPHRIRSREPLPVHAKEEKAGMPPMDGPVVEAVTSQMLKAVKTWS
jgi:hypothetical protein